MIFYKRKEIYGESVNLYFLSSCTTLKVFNLTSEIKRRKDKITSDSWN